MASFIYYPSDLMDNICSSPDNDIVNKVTSLMNEKGLNEESNSKTDT